MQFYEIDIDCEEYVIREASENDNWDRGDYGLKIFGVKVYKSDKNYDFYFEGSKIAVVLVEHFSDGNTFGSQEYAEIKGMFKDENEAIEFASTINTDHGYFGSHINFLYFQVILP